VYCEPGCLNQDVKHRNPVIFTSSSYSVKAKAGFAYAKALMGDNTMEFTDLYIRWLYYIRERSREELALLYLYKQKDQQTGFDVVYNIGSKSIYSAINFEHALCKIYLVIKMQLPENNQSVQPNSASNSTHPLLVGKLDTDPGVVVWGHICPFVCAAMSVIARAYDSLSADNRIHVPSFVAEIQGGDNTIPTSYPSDKFGVPFTQSSAMECLKAERTLLVAGKPKRVRGLNGCTNWSRITTTTTTTTMTTMTMTIVYTKRNVRTYIRKKESGMCRTGLNHVDNDSVTTAQTSCRTTSKQKVRRYRLVLSD
jgi:hypothetical protein